MFFSEHTERKKEDEGAKRDRRIIAHWHSTQAHSHATKNKLTHTHTRTHLQFHAAWVRFKCSVFRHCNEGAESAKRRLYPKAEQSVLLKEQRTTGAFTLSASCCHIFNDKHTTAHTHRSVSRRCALWHSIDISYDSKYSLWQVFNKVNLWFCCEFETVCC